MSRSIKFAKAGGPDVLECLGDEAVKLAPHVHKLADWLGSEWTSLLS
jgi:hypothetical protein